MVSITHNTAFLGPVLFVGQSQFTHFNPLHQLQ